MMACWWRKACTAKNTSTRSERRSSSVAKTHHQNAARHQNEERMTTRTRKSPRASQQRNELPSTRFNLLSLLVTGFGRGLISDLHSRRCEIGIVKSLLWVR